ncbi:MAG TPA: hypothetical protein PKE04_04870 [Clostridia bacterium]|nr:hypothetical protein [Clostridia bacterium]
MQEDRRKSRRRLRFRVAAGVLDFFGVVICTALIIVLLSAMFNLYGWLRDDLQETFAGLSQNMTEAVFIDGD